MPTQTKSNPIDESVEAATERVANNEKVVELNEKAVANGRKAGAYLTSYERAVVALTDSYQRAAGATKVDWIAEVAGTQADFTREVTKAYTSAVRDLSAPT